VTNYYVVQLAVADFAVGIVMPFHVAAFFKEEIVTANIKVCVLRYASIMLFATCSICGLVALTGDRFLAITDPLRYHDKMTTRRYVISGVAMWAPCILLIFLLPMFWHNDFTPGVCPECELTTVLKRDFFRVIITPSFVILSFTMVCLYGRIFSVAAKQMKSIQEIQVTSSDIKHNDSKRNLKQQMKLVKAGLTVFAAFYVCWLPFFTVISIQMYGGLFDSQILNSLRLLSTFLFTFNSAINPIIYTYKMPAFRREFRKIFMNKVDSVEPFSTNSQY
jgi:hypothetical protein